MEDLPLLNPSLHLKSATHLSPCQSQPFDSSHLLSISALRHYPTPLPILLSPNLLSHPSAADTYVEGKARWGLKVTGGPRQATQLLI